MKKLVLCQCKNHGITATQNEVIRFILIQKNDEDEFLLFFVQDSYLTGGKSTIWTSILVKNYLLIFRGTGKLKN